MPNRSGVTHAILLLAACAAGALALAVPPIPQPPGYHAMADERAWLGIPNAADVLSNIPFAIVGLAGLIWTLGGRGLRIPWRDRWERWPYAALFTGVVMTAAGSSYYHLAPDNTRLVWDRLPMAMGFSALLAAVLAERVSVRLARRLLVPLLAAGVGSVVYWRWSELQGAGDLRPYLLVQFGSLVLVLLMLALYRSPYVGGAYLLVGLAAYAAAKVFEVADAAIFAYGGIVSGHTLKHLVAASGVACVVAMLRARARSRPSPGMVLS